MTQMSARQITFSLVGILLFSHQAMSAADVGKLPDVIEFNRDIRPILSDNCFFCHGPDKNKRQADLRLDTEPGLLGDPSDKSKSGTVVPGRPADSELVRRITSLSSEQIMPPRESGKELSPRDVELLKRWVEQGAKYEGHWSFLPLKRGVLHEKATQHAVAASSMNSIDQFILDALSKTGLKPGHEADRVTLIRRLSLDLIGLPPSPEQVDAFVNDQSPDAYERLVNQLLASPHFGERLAIWWLDLVRYADSVGYHGDQDVSVSPYRQYVIESFNANKRFNQFTVEQLAGDLLPEATREQRIASGYNRLGMMSAEGGVQDKEYLAKYIAERVRNASGTWLGVTLGCAECHDHKYDPFSTKDFYRFEAFFADIEERGRYSGANVDGSWGRSIPVPDEQQAVELASLDKKIAETKTILDTATDQLATAQSEWERSQVLWTFSKPDSAMSEGGTTLSVKDDSSILASGTSPAKDTYVLKWNEVPNGVTAIRLEVLPDDSLPKKGPGRAKNGNFVLSEFSVRIQSSGGEEQPVDLQNATATYEQTGAAENNPYKRWVAAAAIDGDANGKNWGWAILEKAGQPQSAVFETVQNLASSAGSTLIVSLAQNGDAEQHTIGRFRILITNSPRPLRAENLLPQAINAILLIAPEQRTDEQKKQLAAHYRTVAPLLEPTRQVLAGLEKERKALDAKIPRTLVTASVSPRMVRVLKRGNWMDDSGEVVTPAFPALFASPPAADQRLTRLDLAKWLTSADNPLTSRVFVNRIWKLLFGAGLSRRVDDLGAQGDWPSHPLLLDELAGKFIDSDWDVKGLIKSIVMSETYRRSSLVTHDLREVDPYNRWLAHQGRFRLDAELVRDNTLAISGLLVTTIGGKSVKPYQPPGYWAHLNFPMREWQNGSGDELYRRGIYTHWQRQYLHPSLIAFDAPCREECTADRPRSNTPLQSLVLLNDPSYVEAARAFAELLIRHGGNTVDDRLKMAFRRAVSRTITTSELDVLKQLLQKHLDEYKSDPAAASEVLAIGDKPVPQDLDKTELAAWTSVARAIMNLHETITRN